MEKKPKKIGVYICHCGGNISDYVDVEKVRQAVEGDEIVFLSKTTMFACSDANQRDMVEDIKANDLDGVVVASCSPKLHLTTFRNVSERANLNKYTYVHANIREQASWAHSDNKMGATEKAIHLVKAAIAKSRYAEALESNKVKAVKAVAVIGAGVAGLKAAISLAEKDTEVILIEREAEVGGRVAQWGSLFSSQETGREMIDRLSAQLKLHKNINLLTNSEVVGNKGSVGNIALKIRRKDPETGAEVMTEMTVGSVLMATGFDYYKPQQAEFGYGVSDRVITMPEFKKVIDTQTSKKLMYNGREVKNIAYIYCVGSRQTDGENTYCSRNCCTSTIHAAVTARQKFSNIQNYHFNRGLRTYGKQEILYADSLRQGDIYFQSYEDGLPVVSVEGKKTIVKVNDVLTANREIEVEADLVVLVTGMVPQTDNSVGSLFKLPKGRDKFYNEVHMKLRPVETVIDGITIAGACQGPKNIAESVNSALSAATKSYSIISKGELESQPLVATIDPSKCSWCGACEKACPFDAILKVDKDGKTIAEINNTVCKGCGMCAPVCEPDAVNLIACSSAEIMSMIDALV
ncbi:MAG: CoB--CoM heterodisulfide reductase iron-sulfur subunit A family protein [Bacteroidia bacterium]|nr:CoB--CoM heterodisulfide reductase iron-sulfur subunit A family protein [Bacteroidia bacterium]